MVLIELTDAMQVSLARGLNIFTRHLGIERETLCIMANCFTFARLYTCSEHYPLLCTTRLQCSLIDSKDICVRCLFHACFLIQS